MRAWLEELLPSHAHTICSNRVHVTVLRLWPWTRMHVHEFVDKEDLVTALLASCHLPLVMDGRYAHTRTASRTHIGCAELRFRLQKGDRE